MDVNNIKHLNKISSLVDNANGYKLDGVELFEESNEEKFLDERNYIAKVDIEKEMNNNDDFIDEEYDDFCED